MSIIEAELSKELIVNDTINNIPLKKFKIKSIVNDSGETLFSYSLHAQLIGRKKYLSRYYETNSDGYLLYEEHHYPYSLDDSDGCFGFITTWIKVIRYPNNTVLRRETNTGRIDLYLRSSDGELMKSITKIKNSVEILYDNFSTINIKTPVNVKKII